MTDEQPPQDPTTGAPGTSRRHLPSRRRLRRSRARAGSSRRRVAAPAARRGLGLGASPRSAPAAGPGSGLGAASGGSAGRRVRAGSSRRPPPHRHRSRDRAGSSRHRPPAAAPVPPGASRRHRPPAPGPAWAQPPAPAAPPAGWAQPPAGTAARSRARRLGAAAADPGLGPARDRLSRVRSRSSPGSPACSSSWSACSGARSACVLIIGGSAFQSIIDQFGPISANGTDVDTAGNIVGGVFVGIGIVILVLAIVEVLGGFGALIGKTWGRILGDPLLPRLRGVPAGRPDRVARARRTSAIRSGATAG